MTKTLDTARGSSWAKVSPHDMSLLCLEILETRTGNSVWAREQLLAMIIEDWPKVDI